MSKTKKPTIPPAKKIDEKQKEEMMAAVFKDYADYEHDALQRRYVEAMVESYLLDSDSFNKMATKMKREEKEGKIPKQTPIEDRITPIQKIAAETEEVTVTESTLKLDQNGMIVA